MFLPFKLPSAVNYCIKINVNNSQKQSMVSCKNSPTDVSIRGWYRFFIWRPAFSWLNMEMDFVNYHFIWKNDRKICRQSISIVTVIIMFLILIWAVYIFIALVTKGFATLTILWPLWPYWPYLFLLLNICYLVIKKSRQLTVETTLLWNIKISNSLRYMKGFIKIPWKN